MKTKACYAKNQQTRTKHVHKVIMPAEIFICERKTEIYINIKVLKEIDYPVRKIPDLAASSRDLYANLLQALL